MSRKQAGDKLLRGLEIAVEIAGLVMMIIPLILRRRK